MTWSSELRGADVVSILIVRAVVDALRLQELAHDELAIVRACASSSVHEVLPRELFLRELELVAQPDLGPSLGRSLYAMSSHFLALLKGSDVSLRDALGIFLRLARDVLGGPRWTVVEEVDDVMVGYGLERAYGRGPSTGPSECATNSPRRRTWPS
jgi:hypothetical protein